MIPLHVLLALAATALLSGSSASLVLLAPARCLPFARCGGDGGGDSALQLEVTPGGATRAAAITAWPAALSVTAPTYGSKV